MREGIRELIKYRLQRADETLEEARLLFKEGRYAGAINRLYYACFYAVLSFPQTGRSCKDLLKRRKSS